MASAPSNWWWCSENRLPKTTWMEDFIVPSSGLQLHPQTWTWHMGMSSTKPQSPCRSTQADLQDLRKVLRILRFTWLFGSAWSRPFRRAWVAQALDLQIEAFCAFMKGTNFSVLLQKRPPLFQMFKAEHSSACPPRQHPQLKAATRKRCLQASHTLC